MHVVGVHPHALPVVLSAQSVVGEVNHFLSRPQVALFRLRSSVVLLVIVVIDLDRGGVLV